MPNSLVVLSTNEQLQVYLADPELRDAHVFCDNEALFSVLEKAKIPFEKIDEFLIRDQWTAINSWGCGRSGLWLKECRTLTPAGSPDILPGIHLYFSCFLITAAKNRAYAYLVIQTARPSRVYVFENGPLPAYPEFSGNAFLNYFLKEAAEALKIPVNGLIAVPPRPAIQKKTVLLQTIARRTYKKIMSLWLRAIQKPCRKNYFLIYGSLRHLETMVRFLHEKGIPVLIYDHDFHKEIFRMAAQGKMPYVTADQLPVSGETMISEGGGSLRRQFALKFNEARHAKYFQYKGYDFCDFIEKMILGTMTDYFQKAAAEWRRCKKILERYPISGCLVEEDFGVRANFCEYMKFSGIPNFCISHGHGGFDFEAEKAGQTFLQSTTFVNSEHEKLKMYLSRGWDGEADVVSGTPRYDQLFNKLQSRSLPTLPKKILYCAGSLSSNTPDTPGYLGIDLFAYRSFQEKIFRDFLKAMQGLPIEIMVKSHYDSDDQAWEQLVENTASEKIVKIFKHSENFHDLLMRSHAMVLPCLSTSLIEAALCRIPVIFMDLYSQNSPTVLEFSAHGLCRHANSVESLRGELEKIVSDVEAPDASKPSSKSQEYFLGRNFGSATNTTGEIILKRLSEVLPRKAAVIKNAKSESATIL